MWQFWTLYAQHLLQPPPCNSSGVHTGAVSFSQRNVVQVQRQMCWELWKQYKSCVHGTRILQIIYGDRWQTAVILCYAGTYYVAKVNHDYCNITGVKTDTFSQICILKLEPSVLIAVYSLALERLKTTGEMYQHQQRKNNFQACLEHKHSFLTSDTVGIIVSALAFLIGWKLSSTHLSDI